MRLILLLGMWLCLALPVRSEPVVSGTMETVFDWDRDRCEPWDGPDGPARAWRDNGGVHLLAGSERTRVSHGPTLDDMIRDCRVLHEGAHRDDPAAFDDRTWVASPYLEPTGRLIALGHAEYHGHQRPDRCAAGDYLSCWWNSIVELSGFPRLRAGRKGAALVAALPMPLDSAQDGRRGYFNPSNVIARDDDLYAFIFAEAAPPQRRGACLIRRGIGGGADDWRAWDGTGFGIAFADPYRDAPIDPARHVCTPVLGLTSTISSVVWRPAVGRYLALTPARLQDGAGVARTGIWWIESPDLIVWTRPQLLLEVPLLWRRDCGATAAYAYPSILDPDSPTANFETADDGFWLYLVRVRLDGDCQTGPARDLVRLPVSWRAPPAE